MACLEYFCIQCGWGEHTNTRSAHPYCPQCGSEDVVEQFDESTHDREREEDLSDDEPFDESLNDA